MADHDAVPKAGADKALEDHDAVPKAGAASAAAAASPAVDPHNAPLSTPPPSQGRAADEGPPAGIAAVNKQDLTTKLADPLGKRLPSWILT